jgi:hypothetical protein
MGIKKNNRLDLKKNEKRKGTDTWYHRCLRDDKCNAKKDLYTSSLYEKN